MRCYYPIIFFLEDISTLIEITEYILNILWLKLQREIERVKAELKKEFEMKDLGAAKLILGIDFWFMVELETNIGQLL